jgi:hypothetical protein
MKSEGYQLSIGELIDRVTIANIKIWHLEQAISDAKKTGDKNAIADMALHIRDLNADRSRLRTEINRIMKDPNQIGNKIEYNGIGRGK